MFDDIKFFKSTRLNENCIYKKNQFYLARSVDNTRIFRCSTKWCPSSLILDKDNDIISEGNHNHDSLSDDKIRKILLKAKFRDLAVKLPIIPKDLFIQETANMDGNELAAFGHSKQNYRTIRNIKKKANMESLKENNDIPEELKYTLSQKLFFQFDSGVSLIQSSCVWICDGTFKSSHPEFKQIFIIHCSIFDNYIPTIYVLLPGKSYDCYINMIIEVKKILEDKIAIKNLICDFEVAIKNAFIDQFPDLIVSHCMFHFGQIVWRQIQKN